MRTRREFNVLLARCFCALIFIALFGGLSFAKGGAFRTEDRYNPQHIDNLPPEIRSAIYRMCSAPKASHPFASYSSQSGTCLHELYESRGGHNRPVRRYYAAPATEHQQ